MTISYSRRFLIVAFVLAVFALTPLVTLAGGGGGGVRTTSTVEFDSFAGTPASNQGSVCTADAKMCPDGSFVGRTGPRCQFAACPTGTSTPNSTTTQPVACTMDAKMCPDGSFVGRTGPNCTFPACPTSTSTRPSDADVYPGAVSDSGSPMPPLFGGGSYNTGAGVTYDSGQTVSNNNSFGPGSLTSEVCSQEAKRCPDGSYVTRSGPSCAFAACPTSTNNNTSGTDSGVAMPLFNNFADVAIPAVSSIGTAINPAFSMFSNAAEFGWDSVARGPGAPALTYTNFAGINIPTTDSGAAIARPRSTSTLQTLLDKIYRRNQATSSPGHVPGAIGGGLLGGGTKPNKTNTIAFEAKVMAVNGDIITNWSTSTAVTIPSGGQLQLRWTASDYTQCLPAFNDNGQYALQAGRRILAPDDRSMRVGDTEKEGYNLPEVTGNYSIECGGQKNGESGVDKRVIKVTGPGTTVPPLFGGGVSNDSGTVSNTDNDPIIDCPLDEKMCPDGSSVSRVSPSCEFAACPSTSDSIDTFSECQAAGYPVTESNPPQCRTPDGRVFTGPAYVADPPVGTFCPMDAKMCPDGSYVGRTGPNCTFPACPTTNQQSDSAGALFGN